MKHGFIKVATASPSITLADCQSNAQKIIDTAAIADEQGVKLLVFPELSVTGSTCGDLFFTDALLRSAQEAVFEIARQTAYSDMIIIIGFPLLVNDKIYNCSAFCQNGQILGIVPRSVLTYDQAKHFSTYSGNAVSIPFGDDFVVFGNGLIFACTDMPSLKIGIEIGSEAFAAVPPSTALCQMGATVIANPFAEAELVGAQEYRHTMLSSLSARNICGYIHAEAGDGESTTDGVFGGVRSVYEAGKLICNSLPFDGAELTVTELDLELISAERRRSSAFSLKSPETLQNIFFSMELTETELSREYPKFPFMPCQASELAARCQYILKLQAQGLAHRMKKAYSETLVIGISGGLDSCLAILVAAEAMDILGKPRKNIIGVTMPCFGTTKRTKSNAEALCEALGASLRCVNIGDSVRQHFSDIGHSEENRNVVYENAQARERTQVIMDIANMENGLVVGTGDLSELVLGWATYNGDHMSMYGVNGGIPKTLIRHVVGYYADCAQQNGNDALSTVLRDILDTPVSPELLPADSEGNIAQRTEDLVGPYELHDFYIYYMMRYGFTPDKLFRIARATWGDKYDDETLVKWLKNLVRRFFAQQFKRSCLPDGPKIGTVGVSPRGDLRMPSDASSAQWLKIIENM